MPEKRSKKGPKINNKQAYNADMDITILELEQTILHLIVCLLSTSNTYSLHDVPGQLFVSSLHNTIDKFPEK